MKDQKTNFYVESQKSGRSRPKGEAEKGEPGGEKWQGHLLLTFAVDLADTI